MSPVAGKLARRILDGVKSFGIARWTIVALLLGIWVLAAVKTDLDRTYLYASGWTARLEPLVFPHGSMRPSTIAGMILT